MQSLCRRRHEADLFEDRREKGVIRLGPQVEGAYVCGLLLQAVAAQLIGSLVQTLLFLKLSPGLQSGKPFSGSSSSSVRRRYDRLV